MVFGDKLMVMAGKTCSGITIVNGVLLNIHLILSARLPIEVLSNQPMRTEALKQAASVSLQLNGGMDPLPVRINPHLSVFAQK